MNSIESIQQIKHIAKVIATSSCQDTIDSLIKEYEETESNNFDSDYTRYMFAYLKTTSMVQAVFLYDAVNDDHKNQMVHAISIDHPHLNELVSIHRYIKQLDTIPESPVYS